MNVINWQREFLPVIIDNFIPNEVIIKIHQQKTYRFFRRFISLLIL